MRFQRSFGLLGGLKAVVSLSASYTAEDYTTGGVGYDVYFELQNDGDIVKYGSLSGVTDLGDWIAPRSAAGALYEARMTTISGTLSSGTTGSWLPLSTTRTWRKTAPGISFFEVYEGTLEIRLASSGTVLASSSVTISGQADP